jgi:glycosyltransferase involved in cell wall biosynthesis
LHRVDAWAWTAFERKVARQSDAVVVFTPADGEVVARLAPDANVRCIPFGTTVPERTLNPIGCSPPRLLFVGNFIHRPNVDTALRLATSIFPKLRQRFPQVVLQLVGDQPPPEVLRLAASDVVVTGRVDSVTPYLDQAAIVLAPILTGGGMRVKVLEALASGKAIIASRLAAEGLDVTNGLHLLFAETDDQFVEAIAGLLSDVPRRAALAAQARGWAVANLDWQPRVQAYQALYDSLLPDANAVAGRSRRDTSGTELVPR